MPQIETLMAWDVRKTYFYLVCFATLLMVIIGSVQAVRHGLDLALPAEPFRPTVAHVLRRAPAEEQARFTREELEQMAAEEAARERLQQQRRSLRGLLGGLALVLIAAPVYVYHWRKVRDA